MIRASVESLLSRFGIRSTIYLVRRELMLPLAGGSEQGRLPVGYSAMGKLSINYLGSDLAVARQSPRSGCHPERSRGICGCLLSGPADTRNL